MARPRSDSWQGDVSVKGHPRQRQDGFKTKEAAELWEAQVREALVSGKPMPKAAVESGERMTLAKGIERVHALSWRGSKSESSMVKVCSHLLRHFGREKPLADIDKNAVDNFVVALKDRGNSDGTINRKLSALSKVLTYADECGAISKRPKIGRRKENEGRIRFLTDAEEHALLALAEQWERHDHADAIRVLTDTGLRLGELFALQRRDIDLARKTLTVWVAKGDRPGTIPLTDRAVVVLRRRFLSHPEGLFPYDQWWMRHTWDQLRAKMGYADDEQFVPHALRHTFVSRLVQSGVPLRVVRDLARHKDIQTTMRYAHLEPGNLTDAIAVLNKRNSVESAAQNAVTERVT